MASRRFACGARPVGSTPSAAPASLRCRCYHLSESGITELEMYRDLHPASITARAVERLAPDFFARVGAPLNLIFWALGTLLLPWFWPF